MSKNPVLPYGIIAVLGILAIIIVSYFGVDQREARENPEESENNVEELSAEDLFKNNCAQCHGDDLSGDSGPGLTDVGSKLSVEEIEDNNITDQGAMPQGQASDAEAPDIAELLYEMEE